MTLDTPVVLIAFNRPESTRRTLDAIRGARPARLFLVCDGPRPECPTDAALCGEVRAVLDEIDWSCQVDRRYSERNLGCEGNVETGLDWVFDQVDRAIVLEDDCVPDPTFFRFAEELLTRYVDDTRVWHVAGNSHHVPSALFGDDSYAFSTWASVWGWATWSDRWLRHRAGFPRDHVRRGPHDRGDAPARLVPARPAPGSLVTRSAELPLRRRRCLHGRDHPRLGQAVVAHDHERERSVGDTGDQHGAQHRFRRGGDSRSRPTRMPPASPARFPLRHPPAVTLHVEVERELELELARVGGRAARIARRLVRSPMLRRAIRAAVYSAPARNAVRKASSMGRKGSRVGPGAGA